MKLLYLHRTQARGVEGVHIGEIVKAMRRLGHVVRIVSPVGEQFGDSASVGAAEPSAGRRLYRVVARYLPEIAFELLELAYNAKAVRDVRRQLVAEDVDAVFERYAIFGLTGAFIARRWGKPFYLEINYTSQSALVRCRSRLLRPLARALDRRLFRQAAGLFAVSSYLRDELVRDFNVPADKIVVLPNAADPEVFDPAKAVAAPVNGRLIGFVGGFYPWHGLPLLLDAFNRVAPEFADVQLLLIGEGPMRAEIERLASRHGLNGRVLLPGRLPHAALPAQIARFHLGVMPDSNEYGSPMKVFEYMAMAKPVVVPDYAPLRDAVSDGREGLIFRPGDAADLARCLAQLLRDPAGYRSMAARARQRVLERHNWLKNAETILQTMTRRVHA